MKTEKQTFWSDNFVISEISKIRIHFRDSQKTA